MDIGKMLKDTRSVSGLSQTECAKLIGVTQPYLSCLENNKKTPSIPFLIKFADINRTYLPLMFASCLGKVSLVMGVLFKPTYEEGYTDKDMEELVTTYFPEINLHAFSEALGVNTATRVGEDLVTFPIDVERALRECLGETLNWMRWD